MRLSGIKVVMAGHLRTAWKSIALLICCSPLLVFYNCSGQPAEDSRPNILLIIADDLSFDHYGFAGHPIVQTPAIDSLAAQSIRYSQAIFRLRV
jgi:hypothetical protein